MLNFLLTSSAGSGWVRALSIASMVVEEGVAVKLAFGTRECEILYSRALEVGSVLEMPKLIYARRWIRVPI